MRAGLYISRFICIKREDIIFSWILSHSKLLNYLFQIKTISLWRNLWREVGSHFNPLNSYSNQKFILQIYLSKKKKKKKNRKNHETNRAKYISKGSIKTERFHRTAISHETFFFRSGQRRPRKRFRTFRSEVIAWPARDPLFPPLPSAQLGGKESVDHARRAAPLISGEIKPRRSKLALHNGVEGGGGRRPNFQFRGQKESSTLKIEIDQSCAATVCFFFPLLPLFPFVFRSSFSFFLLPLFFPLLFFPFDSRWSRFIDERSFHEPCHGFFTLCGDAISWLSGIRNSVCWNSFYNTILGILIFFFLSVLTASLLLW